MFDDGRAVARKVHGHHIEAGGAIEGVGAAEEVLGGLDDSLSLKLGDGVIGVVSRLVCARFDLDKDDGGALRGDQVDLAGWAVVVAGDDAVLLAAQEACGLFLTPAAGRMPPRKSARPRRARAPAAGQQPSYERREVHAAYGPCPGARADSRASRGGRARGASP